MSIHFISGKPGGGKTFYSVKLIFEELRYGVRHIVTNVALNVGELNAYYHEHYADDSGWKKYAVPWWLPFKLAVPLFWYLPEVIALKVFPLAPDQADRRMLQPLQDNICERIHLITDEEMAVFFTKRPGSTIEHIDKEEWRAGKRPDYSVVKDGGVLFVLDEIHIPFNSRAWAETGAEVLYYLSQHRKLGDDVLAITQAVANVDKQFRSVAQDFTYIRNLAKETFGHFRLPARFVRKTYSQPPSGDKSEPMEMGSFTLDVQGLAKCYDTAKGIGIHGRAGADTKERKKGFHWLWFAIGLPVVFYAVLHFIPFLTVHLFGTKLRPVPMQRNGSTAVTNKPVAFQPPQDFTTPETQVPVVAVATHSAPPLGSPVMGTNTLVCVGWTIIGGNAIVFTSDGNDYSTRDGEVTSLSKRSVTINGVVLPVVKGRAFSDYVPSVPEAFQQIQPAQSAEPVDNVQVIRFGNSPAPRIVNHASGFSRMASPSATPYN